MELAIAGLEKKGWRAEIVDDDEDDGAPGLRARARVRWRGR